MTLSLLPVQSTATRVFRDGVWSAGARDVIGETAIAIVVNGSTEAVMMATNADPEDFAIGFATTEGIVAHLDAIESFELTDAELGVEARFWLRETAAARHKARRRQRTGPVGCGLCGVESLEEVLRPIPPVTAALSIAASDLIAGMRALTERQPLNAATRAAHAAALFEPGLGVALAREDVGRHNALDKLAGALVRKGASGAGGAVLMTSRLSIELVQKTAILGASVLAAISAPSALAIEQAERAGIALCGVVRDNGLEVFTHAERIL